MFLSLGLSPLQYPRTDTSITSQSSLFRSVTATFSASGGALWPRRGAAASQIRHRANNKPKQRIASHQSSLPNAAKGYQPREPRESTAVGQIRSDDSRDEAQLTRRMRCLYPGLSPGPINRRLCELLFTPQTLIRSKHPSLT